MSFRSAFGDDEWNDPEKTFGRVLSRADVDDVAEWDLPEEHETFELSDRPARVRVRRRHQPAPEVEKVVTFPSPDRAIPTLCDDTAKQATRRPRVLIGSQFIEKTLPKGIGQ